jgi:phosphatidylserine decarboxylase
MTTPRDIPETRERGISRRLKKILGRQVAGFLARRAVCRAKPGDALKKGDRYGINKFSSRLDIYLPMHTSIKIALGDQVKAGETVIGEVGRSKS